MRVKKRIEILNAVNRLLEKKVLSLVNKDAEVIYLVGGSDREFYRIIDRDTFIAMFASTKDEVEEYLEIQEYLSKKGVGVPEVFMADIDKKVLLIEDVGSKSLNSLVKKSDDMDFIERLYKGVIKKLFHLQIDGNIGIEKCKPVYKRVFDYDALRWESDYFSNSFLQMFCGFSKEAIEKLDEDFHNLALSFVDEPLFFMHRDFQSQNIFFKNGNVRIIDFQSAHRGMLTYDLASLMKDAYVTLTREMREKLLFFYFSLVQEKVGVYRDYKTFRRIYVLSAIQRNMQALGAFSFLSLVKKKRWFIKAIPQGIKYLKEGLDEINDFKSIREIIYSKKVTKCIKSITS
ncbi:MAG: hypothetical protein E3J87_07640 [Candidatus Cloacimonadota bacterium]|nr:MAG: hypothetical protein E3J87_07640 [Candidatus Cloacimonadota bacterium]